MSFISGKGFARLRAGLSKTRDQISRLMGRTVLDEDWLEEIESSLIAADAGARTSAQLVERLRESLRARPIAASLTMQQEVSERLAELLEGHLAPLDPLDPQLRSAPSTPSNRGLSPADALSGAADEPMVLMVVGVNGAGKTTSIGKLAHHAQSAGRRVLLAAGDTFRAAAQEQLQEWGRRNGVAVIAQSEGDPAAVAFDAVKAGLARRADWIIVDTAGRLPTQLHLMEELKKVKRVIGKAMETAPHEVWLVVDGGTGQNALAQVKAFDDALGLTGLVVTKLDGTAKGGVLLSLATERPIPVRFIGVGEGIEDLQAFEPRAFARAMIGLES
ncbi:MAG: signal recognition particle-docking protein FtsY [Betaproteobacteria bacterium]|nr:signal recognition particle-docking protein FtsY [Betaproteobacteria bacterium]